MKVLRSAPYWIIFVFIMSACNKDRFLDKKSNTSIIIPTSLPDLRSLMDNTGVFTVSPGLGEIAADDYYVNYQDWQAMREIERNSYTWEKNIYGGSKQVADWTTPCQQILYTNIVLDQVVKLKPSAQDLNEWGEVKGSALFLRAFAFLNLVQHFAPAYDSASAATDLGIPLRLDPDIKHIYQRASLKDCYDRILDDLREAVPLLPKNLPLTARNRPSRPAAYALLSRACLYTRQFRNAALYADSCLKLYNKLIDYNMVSTTAITPFEGRSGDENIYYCQPVTIYSTLGTYSNTVFADTLLYQSYHTNDLRKLIFFRTISGSNMGFKRGYSGTVYPFTGLTTDEIYLNKAEGLARTGDAGSAMDDLNTLLAKRWKTGTFIPFVAANAREALQIILVERRKELVWRGLRWLDLKRYNREGAAITISRKLNDQIYQLTPNSPLYIFPFPDDEISLSGIIQNPR